ncbi:DUF3237 domain-containing protein [Novosphingobium sp. B-7]|uniref:DUF3237 domain-containing protein n=1 Tax=Novosphingobium sp. B-7 TaxID=1298855 RepID=UPI0003B601D3|nr:DUF3237 domain-containing protein [Novosphingobium sp. B-7]
MFAALLPRLAAPALALLAAPVAALPAVAHADASMAPPPVLEPAFRAHVLLGESLDVGQTPRGGRSLVRITGGTVDGPMLHGVVLPGGWDWQLHGAGGCIELHADYMLKAADGAVINVVNHAKACPGPHGEKPQMVGMPMFEAPLGPQGWLNSGAYVATVTGGSDPAHPAVDIAVYKVR